MNFKVSTGVTLIELLVVITILAILGAIAIPAYKDYSTKARRSEGRAALNSILLAQERYMTVNGGYATDLGVLTADVDASLNPLVVSGENFIDSEYENYRVSINNDATSSSFTLTATAQGAQANDEYCSTMTITNLGVKSGTVSAAFIADGKTNADNKCW
jgi:type IV pilus assembly protein PilE